MPLPSYLRLPTPAPAAPVPRIGADGRDDAAAGLALGHTARRVIAGAAATPPDWDSMLSAVKDRLTRTVDASSHVLGGTLLRAGDPHVQTAVLDCVKALDQLHVTLRHELGRCEQLELAVFDSQTALAQVRADRVGTPAGAERERLAARHDGLTLLPSRGHFLERLALALETEAPRRRAVAVLCVELDGVKPINDQHGHDVGEQLRRIVAARLRRAVRADDLVSWLGGGEFACLLADLPGRDQLCRLAGKLYDAMAAPAQVGALQLTVRPSIGIATCPAGGITSAQLLEHADAAMQRAKRQRCGYAFFDQWGT